MRCGSTGPSGPTAGCSTARTHQLLPTAEALPAAWSSPRRDSSWRRWYRKASSGWRGHDGRRARVPRRAAAGGGAACGSDEPDSASDQPIQERDTTTEDEGTASTGSDDAGPLADVSLELTEIGDFDKPISIIGRPDDTTLFVAERDGRVLKLAVDGEGDDRDYTPEDDPLL